MFRGLQRLFIFRSLHIGNLSQIRTDILDNIQEAVARLFENCPCGKKNVRSLYLRVACDGQCLPLYIDLGKFSERVSRWFLVYLRGHSTTLLKTSNRDVIEFFMQVTNALKFIIIFPR